MIRVLVNHDRIARPIPIGDVVQIIRRDAPIKIVEPESARTATFEMKDVPWTEAATEAPMLPRMIQVVMSITAAGIMANPFSVLVDVWRVRMTWLVLKVSRAMVLPLCVFLAPLLLLRCCVLLTRSLCRRRMRWRTMRWNESSVWRSFPFPRLAICGCRSKSREYDSNE